MGKKLSSAGEVASIRRQKNNMATTAFAGIAAIGVKYNATMETYATSFEVMTGSAEKAAEEQTEYFTGPLGNGCVSVFADAMGDLHTHFAYEFRKKRQCDSSV